MRPRFKRGVGYCLNEKCEQHFKGVFLLNHGNEFICPDCKRGGRTINEEGQATGESEFWKTVKLHWNYDPVEDRYRAVSIVKDDALWGDHKTYHMWSPMIRTENRAMKTAERLLANLQMYSQTGDEVPGQLEQTLDIDKPRDEFRKDLRRVAKSWKGLKESRLHTITEEKAKG